MSPQVGLGVPRHIYMEDAHISVFMYMHEHRCMNTYNKDIMVYIHICIIYEYTYVYTYMCMICILTYNRDSIVCIHMCIDTYDTRVLYVFIRIIQIL